MRGADIVLLRKPIRKANFIDGLNLIVRIKTKLSLCIQCRRMVLLGHSRHQIFLGRGNSMRLWQFIDSRMSSQAATQGEIITFRFHMTGTEIFFVGSPMQNARFSVACNFIDHTWWLIWMEALSVLQQLDIAEYIFRRKLYVESRFFGSSWKPTETVFGGCLKRFWGFGSLHRLRF